MPCASGVLRGNGCFAIEEENDINELTRTNARQREFRFIAGCLAVHGKAVKWEHDQ